MKTPTVTAAQAAAFRLSRHRLDDRGAPSPVAVCAAIGGVQAQIMSAAEIAIHARSRSTTRDAIQDALWTKRTLVKTSAMRATLHLLSARDFSICITALGPSATAVRRGVLERIGVTRADLDRMNAALLDALVDGPQTYRTLVARVRRTARASMRTWLEGSWSAVRPAVIDGLICYGPPQGSEATFVRVDRWLPAARDVSPEDARRRLLRRFLAAYGPATARDFSKWSGLRAPEAREAWQSAGGEIIEVSVSGTAASILAADLDELRAARLDPDAVCLLGGFDPFLLAHVSKDHLVDPRWYKRVYRPQGWISPVVLVGGRVAGVWSIASRGRTAALEVAPFGQLTPVVRTAIGERADSFGRFLGAGCNVRII